MSIATLQSQRVFRDGGCDIRKQKFISLFLMSILLSILLCEAFCFWAFVWNIFIYHNWGTVAITITGPSRGVFVLNKVPSPLTHEKVQKTIKADVSQLGPQYSWAIARKVMWLLYISGKKGPQHMQICNIGTDLFATGFAYFIKNKMEILEIINGLWIICSE